MNVSFKRTGARRYAVMVTVPGEPTRAADPAPGFDEEIPHDLVHYVVEAELRLANGVFGRAARGAGTFIATAEQDLSPRERARQQRKQRRRERALQSGDARAATEMAMSERLAALSDVAWRRRAGQKPDAGRAAPTLRPEEVGIVDRVVARLDVLAPLWRALPVGGELVFVWPSAEPTSGAGRSGGIECVHVDAEALNDALAALPESFDPLLLTFRKRAERGSDGDLTIGADGGTELRIARDGHVVSVDPSGELPSRFVNSTVSQLARFIEAYREYVALVTATDEEAEAQRLLAQLRTRLLSIDPRALADEEAWWSVVLEQAHEGLL